MDIEKTTDSIVSQMDLWENFHKNEIKRIVRRCAKYNEKIETAIKRFDTNELYLDKLWIINCKMKLLWRQKCMKYLILIG